MCTYLLRHTSGTYYFRMGIPLALRPSLGGRREIKLSLATKDRETAKSLIPDYAKEAQRQIREARLAIAAANAPKKTKAQLERERIEWEREQEQADWQRGEADRADAELDELEPVMDALAAGEQPEASPAVIAKAGKRLVAHEREMAEIGRIAAIASKLRPVENRHAPEAQHQAVDWQGRKGNLLDPDIFDRWKAEGAKRPKTLAMVKATVGWFHDRVGKLPVEQITKATVLDFKNKLLAEGHSIANVNIRLSHISLLLGWAARNDIVPANVAVGTSIADPQSKKKKRKPFDLPALKAIFGGPVHGKGARPAGGKGEAAYWLPVLALYTGARVRELAQLRRGDVRLVDYADADGVMQKSWFLNITEDTDDEGLETAIKTDASERLVPIHPKLIELGFIAYVEGLADQKGRVFPKLPEDIYGNPSAKWGEWFSGYMRRVCGVTDKRMTFHSFRHTFKDYARDARIEEGIQRQIMGHEGGDVADNYGSGYSLHVIAVAIQQYRVPGLEINSPQHTDTV